MPLASNQVQFSLTYRAPERNGVLDACRELGVTLIAYSPLAQGLLTGAAPETRAAPPSPSAGWVCASMFGLMQLGLRQFSPFCPVLVNLGNMPRAGRRAHRLQPPRAGPAHGPQPHVRAL